MTNENTKSKDDSRADGSPKLHCLVRQCLGCGNITAADLENTPQLRREMMRDGQVVREVTHEECMKLWKTAKACECK